MERRQSPIPLEELAAWVALHSVPGSGASSLGRLVARFGSARAVLQASPDDLRGVPRVPGVVVDGVVRAARELDLHRGLAERLVADGIEALGRRDARYPTRLHALASPPPLLYVLGRLARGNRRTFGIVGTTRPSRHGAQVAAAVAADLAAAGWVIISGNARGIDAAAHRGALDARRPTVMVLPTGILRFSPRAGYPPPERLRTLAAAVSECHPAAPWTTPAALARNRLIAALSDALLVVETGERGGTLSTLRHAVALGRPSFVVRFKTPALSASGNAVAEQAGARPIRSLRELRTLLDRPDAPTGQQRLPW